MFDDERCSLPVFHLPQSVSLVLLDPYKVGLKTGNVCKKLDLLLLLLMMTITIAQLLFLRVNAFSCISAAKRIQTIYTNAWRWAVIWSLPNCQTGWDSVVSIATCYGLEGSGIKSRWGRDFLHPSRLALGPTQTPIQWVPGIFPQGKAAWAWRWPSTPI